MNAFTGTDSLSLPSFLRSVELDRGLKPGDDADLLALAGSRYAWGMNGASSSSTVGGQFCEFPRKPSDTEDALRGAFPLCFDEVHCVRGFGCCS